MITRNIILAVALSIQMNSGDAATTLPVGPYTFDTNSDYDNNFKESGLYTGITRNSAGYLQLAGTPNGIALYDTSSTGGASGMGATSGSNANNDLDNFVVSGAFSGSTSAGAGAGYLLRLNDSGTNGYLAAIIFPTPSQIRFQLFEGAGINSAGSQIFSQIFSPDGFSFTANTFYTFSVSADGGNFAFNFSDGLASTSFTDTSVSATQGQIRINLATPSFAASTRFDNFALKSIPEPHSVLLFLVAIIVLVVTQFQKPCNQRAN